MPFIHDVCVFYVVVVVILLIPEMLLCAYFKVVKSPGALRVHLQLQNELQTKRGNQHNLSLAVLVRQKGKTDVASQHHQSKPQLMEVHLCCFLLILYFLVTGGAHVELSSAGLRFTFIAVGGLVMLSTRRSMNDHRVRARLRFLRSSPDCSHQPLSSLVLHVPAVCSVMVSNQELHFSINKKKLIKWYKKT